MRTLDHIAGHTVHARRGEVRHRFGYSVDYVMLDPEVATKRPRLFSRNRFNLLAVHDRNHGGTRGDGRGAAWAREVFAQAGLTAPYELRLLTQPSFLGYTFNPVSFWIAQRGDALLAVIAEVNNTFGHRHSYLCHLPDFRAIPASARITADKLFHVSPFQDISGQYHFNFHITPARIAIRIEQYDGTEGVIATLTGDRRALSDSRILGAVLRKPFGALRTIALIYWQALRLKLKGAPYRACPAPPAQDLSTCTSQTPTDRAA